MKSHKSEGSLGRFKISKAVGRAAVLLMQVIILVHARSSTTNNLSRKLPPPRRADPLKLDPVVPYIRHGLAVRRYLQIRSSKLQINQRQ